MRRATMPDKSDAHRRAIRELVEAGVLPSEAAHDPDAMRGIPNDIDAWYRALAAVDVLDSAGLLRRKVKHGG